MKNVRIIFFVLLAMFVMRSIFNERSPNEESMQPQPEPAQVVPEASLEPALTKIVDESRKRAKNKDAQKFFILQGSASTPAQLTLAMTTYQMFEQLLDVPSDRKILPSAMTLELLGAQADWEKFVEKSYPQESWVFAKTKVGSTWNYGDNPYLVGNVGGADDSWKNDLIVHAVAHTLLQYYQDAKQPPLWIAEGLAYLMQFYLVNTAQNYCIPGEPMLEDPTWDLASPEQWRSLLKKAVQEDKSPDLSQMVKAQLESMTSAERIKIFSVMEYILARRRTEFIEVLRQLRADYDHDTVMESVFGFKKLDDDWKKFVLETYP